MNSAAERELLRVVRPAGTAFAAVLH
jgi:hypothetical protein